jgi:hypothetical protein
VTPKAFLLDVARGFDAGMVYIWRQLRRWWDSPWPLAVGAAAFFASSIWLSDQPLVGFGLGCFWLYIGFRQAVRGSELVALRDALPQTLTLGLFRIRLLTIALIVALLILHSDYALFTQLAYAATAAILLLGLDKDIKR